MVWIKETKKQGEVSKNKTLWFPYSRLQRRGEGAKVQQQCAPSWRRSADARLSARCPGRSSRGPSPRGEPYPQSVVGPPRRGEAGLHEGAERSRSRRGH